MRNHVGLEDPTPWLNQVQLDCMQRAAESPCVCDTMRVEDMTALILWDCVLGILALGWAAGDRLPDHVSVMNDQVQQSEHSTHVESFIDSVDHVPSTISSSFRLYQLLVCEDLICDKNGHFKSKPQFETRC